MPWGTDDGGHYYVSPVEQAVMQKERMKRKAAAVDAELEKKKPKTYVECYVEEDKYAALKDEFCRHAVAIDECKRVQKQVQLGCSKYRESLRDMAVHLKRYNVILRQLHDIYDEEQRKRGVADG